MFLVGITTLGAMLAMYREQVRKRWNDPNQEAGVIYGSVGVVLLWPAAIALWLGWQVGPPVKRSVERRTGRSSRSEEAAE